MHEIIKSCPDLNSSEVCFVVQQYFEGKYTEKFHKHVSRCRISREMRISLLRALVVRFSGIGAETILQAHLNKRGREPHADGSLQIRVDYTDKGTRTYCGCNTLAWFDE